MQEKIPGTFNTRCINECDAAERGFQNGKEYMRTAVIDKLTALKGRAFGRERLIYGEVIEIVRKMEVRP